MGPQAALTPNIHSCPFTSYTTLVQKQVNIYVHHDRFLRIIDTWRGVTPVIHFRNVKITFLNMLQTPKDKELLLEQGYKKAKPCAPSDYMWNPSVNDWALESPACRYYGRKQVQTTCKY